MLHALLAMLQCACCLQWCDVHAVCCAVRSQSDLTEDQYHKAADETLDILQERLEVSHSLAGSLRATADRAATAELLHKLYSNLVATVGILPGILPKACLGTVLQCF